MGLWDKLKTKASKTYNKVKSSAAKTISQTKVKAKSVSSAIKSTARKTSNAVKSKVKSTTNRVKNTISNPDRNHKATSNSSSRSRGPPISTQQRAAATYTPTKNLSNLVKSASGGVSSSLSSISSRIDDLIKARDNSYNQAGQDLGSGNYAAGGSRLAGTTAADVIAPLDLMNTINKAASGRSDEITRSDIIWSGVDAIGLIPTPFTVLGARALKGSKLAKASKGLKAAEGLKSAKVGQGLKATSTGEDMFKIKSILSGFNSAKSSQGFKTASRIRPKVTNIAQNTRQAIKSRSIRPPTIKAPSFKMPTRSAKIFDAARSSQRVSRIKTLAGSEGAAKSVKGFDGIKSGLKSTAKIGGLSLGIAGLSSLMTQDPGQDAETVDPEYVDPGYMPEGFGPGGSPEGSDGWGFGSWFDWGQDTGYYEPGAAGQDTYTEVYKEVIPPEVYELLYSIPGYAQAEQYAGELFAPVEEAPGVGGVVGTLKANSLMFPAALVLGYAGYKFYKSRS